MTIYKIQNKINGKIYVGQTARSVTARLREHLSGGNKPSMLGKHHTEEARKKMSIAVKNSYLKKGMSNFA
jgi:hypothetical protein